jgi:hypothetical protein
VNSAAAARAASATPGNGGKPDSLPDSFTVPAPASPAGIRRARAGRRASGKTPRAQHPPHPVTSECFVH